MKIQLLSDLHLEAHPHWQATPALGADLLVLAGDIGSYQPGHQMPDSDFGLRQFSPALGWPTPVLFVPGNHEYDTLDFDVAHARLRETCERLGLLWLERASMQLPWTDRLGRPLRFVGTTLWSDFAALDAPEKAFRAANYYLKKTGTTRLGEPFLAEQVREQSLICQNWLRAELAKPFDGATVVVTHFAPSLKSADPRYGLTPGTAGFCNALDALLPQAQLWLHGHLHAPSDYMVGNCRVVANPLGYARKNEQTSFRPAHCIEI
jgi:Icc-related predicted phosphoesterase